MFGSEFMLIIYDLMPRPDIRRSTHPDHKLMVGDTALFLARPIGLAKTGSGLFW